MTIKYMVEVRNRETNDQSFYEKMTKKKAVKTALAEKQANADNRDMLIFVSFYNTQDDNNHGYLNYDGNHSPLALSWNH